MISINPDIDAEAPSHKEGTSFLHMQFQGLKPIFDLPLRQGTPLIVAGPCSAESRRQTLETAVALKEAGVPVFRAGVWKPRTKPGGFEGAGTPALEWLREVRESTGMAVVTEVATPAHLAEALGAGIDGVWIGARTATNPFAVQEIADALALLPPGEKDRLTVLVKNPVNPDLELWIGALERIYGAGVRRLGAIHRGFSSYGPHLYRNQPRWAIPIELKRRIPALPLIFDPSHIGGRADLVGPLCRQAADLDFDGLMVEAHCCPATALSDAAQQVTPALLHEIHSSLSYRDRSVSPESLDELRRRIDRVDDELLELLARRMEISREIGDFKSSHNIPVIQPERYNALMERRVEQGEALGLSPVFLRDILALIHEESVRRQLP